MDEADAIFREHSVTHVVPVANPFVHLIKCMRLVRNKGYRLVNGQVTWIGFDKKSDQWWTRGPFVLLYYTIRQMVHL
jgi:hypothetical protein